jgi:hypothetical protein
MDLAAQVDIPSSGVEGSGDLAGHLSPTLMALES